MPYSTQPFGTCTSRVDRHSTLMAFEVDDIETTVEDMRSGGVTFEEYDLPDIKTEGGIADLGHEKGAWFKDPDGNILAVVEVVRKPAAVS